MIDRLRYPIFFAIMAIYLVLMALDHSIRWYFLWPAISCATLAAAYWFDRPDFVCRKDAAGNISYLMVLINLPWLIFTWAIWGLVVLLSREPNISPIPGTNLSISRYPLAGIDLSNFDRVFDLTAEFPHFYSASRKYECLPNLDGAALANLRPSSKPSVDERILVHCAQGHGRSATFSSLLLTDMGLFETPDLAYQAIISARPAARVARSQLLQLQACRSAGAMPMANG